MQIVGIICEYNPLHNGHKYQIQKARELSGADAVLCIMSGYFVQRGEVAILSPQQRASLAISSGADIVIQLPSVFATNSAELFAKGAISILNTIPNVTHLSFGVEDNNADSLCSLAKILASEPKKLKADIKDMLSKGTSYPTAMQNAVSLNYPHLAHILEKPNNLLGIEYIKALLKADSKIEIVPMKREKNNKLEFDTASPSATFIRNNIANMDLIKKCLPSKTFDLLSKQLPPNKQILDALVMHKLFSLTANKLRQLSDISEGLENTIKKHLPTCSNLDELRLKLNSKRYTAARINRILIQALLDITTKSAKIAIKNPYIKVLAINKSKKQEIMQALTKSSARLILQGNDYNSLDVKTKCLVDIDINAQTIYNILTNQTDSYFKIIEV